MKTNPKSVSYPGSGAARVRSLGLAALVLALVASCGSAQTRYASHLARGEQYLADGKLDKASVEFRNAIQVEPKGWRAWLLAGRAAERGGDLRSAVGRYQQAVELNADSIESSAALGRVFVLAGAPARALDVVGPAVLRHPDAAPLLAIRSAARAQQSDLEGALADAQRSVSLAPDDAEVIALLAAVLRRSGQTTQAIGLLEGALVRLPSSSDLRGALAALYTESGEQLKALAELRRIVELLPKNIEPRYGLASALAKFGKLDEAQHVLEEATVRFPADPNVKLVLIDFISSQRSRQEGERTLRGFIEREPRNLDLRLGLGALLQRNGAVAEAMAVYRDLMARDERSRQALIARDRIAAYDVSQGRIHEADVLLGEVLAQNPRDSDALALRGNLELQQGNAAAAIADLRAVVRDLPRAPGPLRALAQAHVMNGEPALAEEVLRGAVENVPADLGLRMDLASLLGQTDREDKGLALLEEGVRRAPQDAPAREALIRAELSVRRFDAARTAAEDLKTLLPKAAIGSYLAGLAAVGQNRPQEAERELLHARQLQPTATDILEALARLDVSQGHAARAVARVRSALSVSPENAFENNLLGEMLLADKQVAAAQDAFRFATRAAPKWPAAWRNLAMSQYSAGDAPGAIATYEAGLAANPNEPVLVVDLATLDERQRRIDDAVQVYEAALAGKPGLEVVSNNLAMLLLSYRKDERSVTRAVALTEPLAKSNNPAYLDTRGWALYRRGRLADAIGVLERASKQAPDSQVIRYHLGMTELKLGDAQKARSDLEAALARSDEFVGAQEARTVLASLHGGTGSLVHR